MGWGRGVERGRTLRRLLRLMKRCEWLRYAPSLAQLAQEFDVCERTIRRDLELLESSGIRMPKHRVNERLHA